ncbi:MAG: hypothetical protein GY760_10565 [Deltaproteobacteria bacterium]|nr:hypothetical protein [Deltaproteobacteria bacterium]
MRKDFVSNVSHELKTPVTLINGYVETLIDGASRDKEKLDQFLNIINRHSKRISSIISDLLILSNIEDRGNNIIYEDLFLYDLLFSVYTSVLDNAENGEISLKIECDDQLKISANPILLEQAIFNLVSNALKYSGKGSQVIITGKMGSSTSNKQIHIQVKDDGIGIAKDQLDRIFERFYRVKKKHGEKMEGTGLGLSIVRHIILAHNGSIDVSSQEGKGCCFSIALPC